MENLTAETQRFLTIRLILVAMALILGVSVLGAQSDGVTIHTPSVIVSIPVNGNILLAGNLPGTVQDTGNNQLLSINTSDGITDVLSDETYAIPPFVPNHSKTRVAYFQPQAGVFAYDISTNTKTTLIGHSGSVKVPQSWSTNDEQLLINDFAYDESSSNFVYKIQLYDLAKSSFTTIFTFIEEQPLNEFPLPNGIPSVDLYRISQVLLNPKYADWVLLQFIGTNPSITTLDGYLRIIPVTVLYNLQTNQAISIDNLLDDPIRSGSVVWNSEGNTLALHTEGSESKIQLINIVGLDTATPSLQAKSQAVSNPHNLVGWFGVDDMVVSSMRDPQSDDVVFYISQIIRGEWFTQEFVRLYADQFDRTGMAEWVLYADDQEKHELSCLFDQAPPTQFSIGDRGRTLSALTLYAEPDFASAELTQLPEGTEFDIIGGSACINAESYYRLWQIELYDGTIGWAIEADLDGYFMALGDTE